MRGKGPELLNLAFNTRITPAYAGKSVSLQNHEILRRDHPRLCGEKALICAASVSSLGSPPPMRGKGRSSYQRNQNKQDHPRLCGEKVILPWTNAVDRGSPPPMRGKGLSGLPPAGTAGITPAYAGKRAVFQISCTLSWDHPRLCGEKVQIDV